MVPGAGLGSLALETDGLLARTRWPRNGDEEGNGGGGGARGAVTLEGAGLPCLPVINFRFPRINQALNNTKYSEALVHIHTCRSVQARPSLYPLSYLMEVKICLSC